MAEKFVLSTFFFSLSLLASTFSFAVEIEPSLHQVYEAVEAGRFEDAQALMRKVLRAHPNSAKAHYVESELFAKQGLFSNAQTELNTAERLSPGLAFVDAKKLEELKAHIYGDDLSFIEKPLEARTVRLPKLDGFSAACEESSALMERASALAPKNSRILTCLVEESKWRQYRLGKSRDLYPYIAITAVNTSAKGAYTRSEFQEVRQRLHAQLGDMMAKSSYAQAHLNEQDKRIADKGGNLERQKYQETLSGFFDASNQSDMYSYLVTRNATISEGGATEKLCEFNAVSVIYFEGVILSAMVIDNCLQGPEGLRARKITSRWLTAFGKDNEPRE